MRPSLAVAGLLVALLAGCTPSGTIDPAVAQQAREQFVADITSEPVGVRALRQWAAEGPQDDVVVVGTVGGMPNPFETSLQPDFPWVRGEAGLFLVDDAVAEQFKGHLHTDPDHECAFCARTAKQNADGVALVQFCDPQGQPLPHPAADLLGLQAGQRVVVRGKAEQLGELLVVNARSIDLQ